MKTPITKWISTYQCQDCSKLVQVQYSCGHEPKRHKANVLRSLDITEGKCRGCGEQLTANTIHYFGHRQLIEQLQNKLDEISFSVNSIEKLNAEISALSEFIRSTKAWRDFEHEKYKADET